MDMDSSRWVVIHLLFLGHRWDSMMCPRIIFCCWNCDELNSGITSNSFAWVDMGEGHVTVLDGRDCSKVVWRRHTPVSSFVIKLVKGYQSFPRWLRGASDLYFIHKFLIEPETRCIALSFRFSKRLLATVTFFISWSDDMDRALRVSTPLQSPSCS